MNICTRFLARVPQHAHKSPKAVFILIEHFRRNRQEFRRGARVGGTIGLPIVPLDPPAYLSTYQNQIKNPATCTLDLV